MRWGKGRIGGNSEGWIGGGGSKSHIKGVPVIPYGCFPL